MGRIKTALIKRSATKLIKKYKFSNDFNKNKKIVTEIEETKSKKLRNIIAGYLTRLVKKEKEK